MTAFPVFSSTNALDNRIPLTNPFVPMGDQDNPAVDGVFEAGGLGAARVEITRNLSNTLHTWCGYIKVIKSGTLYLRADADTEVKVFIPYLNYTLRKNPGTLNTVTGVVTLARGYYYCVITHQHFGLQGYEYEGCVVLGDWSSYPAAGTYVSGDTAGSRLALGRGIELMGLFSLMDPEGSSSSSSGGGDDPEWGFSSSEDEPEPDPDPDPEPEPEPSSSSGAPYPGGGSSSYVPSSSSSSLSSSSSAVSSSESSSESSASSQPDPSESSSESSASLPSSSESSLSSESSSSVSSLSSLPDPSGESSDSSESTSSDPPQDEPVCPECGDCDEDCSQGDGQDAQRLPFGDDQESGGCEGSGSVDGNPDPDSPPSSRRSGLGDASEPVHCGIGFRYDSPMEWKMTYEENLRQAVIMRPSGRAQYYKAAAGSATAERQGLTRKDGSLAQLLKEDLSLCTEGVPAYVKVAQRDGSAQRFSVRTGEVVEVTTKTGAILSAEAYAARVQVTRNSAGEVTSIWSATQGLLRVERYQNHLAIGWYTHGQFTGDAQSGWEPLEPPKKSYSYTCRYEGDVKVMDIVNQQDEGTSLCIERRIEGNNVTIIEGKGGGGIVTAYERNYLPGNKWEEVKSVRGTNEVTPASCTRTIKKNTAGGWLVLSRTEGYGSSESETTTYTYNDQYRVSLEIRPDGGYTRYEYDELGRVILEASPWADRSTMELVTRTTYADMRFNDYRPALVKKSYLTEGGTENYFLISAYTYEDSSQVQRTTIVHTPNYFALPQTEVSELYGEGAMPVYARGRVKMKQAVDGVQQTWSYEETNLYGAFNKVVREFRVDGLLVPGRSEREIQYIARDGTVTREESYVHSGEEWSLIGFADYEYDEQRRRTKATRGNGRVSTTEWMCCGPLREVDEDGVMTSYGYNSARQLVEIIRSETETTPESITTFTRDAAGRVLTEGSYIGSMHRQKSSTYNRLGRVIRQTDELGRVTTIAYANYGLKETVTLPSGAQQVTERNYDGSLHAQSLPGKYPLTLYYGTSSVGKIITSRITGTDHWVNYEEFDAFGRRGALMGTRIGSNDDYFMKVMTMYNGKGQLIERTERGVKTTYEYDIMGELCTEIRPQSASPSPYNSPYTQYEYTYETKTDGVYRKTTVITYNAEGQPLTSAREELISQLSPTLESKTIETDIYGNVTTTWTEYNGATKRKIHRTIPSSTITAETQVTDGFTILQKDNAGVTTTWSRAYTATGSTFIQTDGRGNSITEVRDIVDRVTKVTDAAGNSTSIDYDLATRQASVITNALGNTAYYKYDIYGRKTAEYGTGIQPACFSYDEAGNLTRLTLFRCEGETITTDPSPRSDGDLTEWEYAWQEKAVLKKIYADGSSVTTQYGDMNRITSVTNARGQTVRYTYDVATGLLKSRLYSDEGTPDIFYIYNYLGELEEVIDGSGTREINYDAYGRQDAERVTIQGTVYCLKENYDAYGRNSGHELIHGSDTLLHAVQGYGADGRLVSAGLQVEGGMKNFTYSYLSGTYLPETLTMPNGVTREVTYEERRDLPTQILYKKDNLPLSVRTQTYNVLSTPITRTQQRGDETARNDSFINNDRNELTGAVLGTLNYVYAYDNIGNRKTEEKTKTEITYDSNNLNQYISIAIGENIPFLPAFDTDGNQTKIQTESGFWIVTYNVADHSVRFAQGSTVIECGYDYMGRRWFKKVTLNGTVTKHERYLYREYLQIAALDMLQNAVVKHTIIWDPTEPIATRPVGLIINEDLYLYGFDLNKNVTELFDNSGDIVANYDYEPYGTVTERGEKASLNPLLFSSEMYDDELKLMYYNYRYLNTFDGRWVNNDRLNEYNNMYCYVYNNTYGKYDYLGNEQGCVDYFDEPPLPGQNKNYSLLEVFPNGWGTNDMGGVDQNQVEELYKLKEKVESLRDKLDRPCYEINIHNNPLNSDGMKALPWGCDKAFITAHTKKTEDGFYIASGGKRINSCELQEGVTVYGCHLAGAWNGRSISQQGAMEMILESLRNLPQKDCCAEVERILVASGTHSGRI